MRCSQFLVILWMILSLPQMSEAQFPAQGASAFSLAGSIDIHIHTAPDVFQRSLNDIELAQLCMARNMRAVVIKNHYESTSARARLTNSILQSNLVFGGVTLNESVGGINPKAVEAMYRIAPDVGKFVWFPTLDAAQHARVFGLKNRGISILDGEKLTKPTLEVLRLIAQYNLVLATGHLAPAEVMLLVKEAKALGVRHMVVTHALADTPGLSLPQMKELVSNGVFLEFTYLSFISGPQAQLPFLQKSSHVSMEKMAAVIEEIGAEHIILSSDLGQMGNAIPPDGLSMIAELLQQQGISAAELELMLKDNPARLLGLE
ncbi:histidinol phosphatase [Arundinibacter roseus]|uniref:Histidinol phosphatase n=2 Tax=Arundinibacter roseus TaxID=2070510 RepID=A0A4R4K5K2_9BACT|nr:histidinol phosphatase [Arundinibacter roseus]